MRRYLAALLAATAGLLVSACDAGAPVEAVAPELLSASGSETRPFKGTCAVTVTARAHEEAEAAAHDDDHEGGPPIPRRLEVAGTCQLTHLGRTALAGRLNVTGPLTSGHHETAAEDAGEHGGQLGVRGHLVLTAANGDVVSGRYLPVSAMLVRTAGQPGGRLEFVSTMLVGRGHDGHDDAHAGDGAHGTGSGEGDEGAFPPCSGRFDGATGSASLHGRLTIGAPADGGAGTLDFSEGSLSY